jgi:glycosyltransferase involved in cell wall biosynthesis
VEQTVLPKEIIVVDDCSKDSSYSLVQELSREFSSTVRFVVLRNERNIGPSATRNIAWSRASCRYVAFLDADDMWLPQKLEHQYSWMLAHPYYVLSGHKCIYPNKSFINGQYSFDVITPRRILISNPFPTPSVMVIRDIPHRFDPTQHFLEDHLLWAEISLAGGLCAYSKDMLAQVHKNPYGDSGLSKSLINMERGELLMYYKLYQKELISAYQLIALWLLSVLKFIRRVWIQIFRVVYSLINKRKK